MIHVADSNFWLAFFAKPVHERLGEAPMELVDLLRRYCSSHGLPEVPTAVAMDNSWRRDVSAAVAGVPAVLLRRLESLLIGIFLVRGIGSSAVTDVVAVGGGPVIGFVIAMDPDAFEGRTANDWATWKENKPFVAEEGVALKATIASPDVDNRQSALRFILLHEIGHVVASGTEVQPDTWAVDENQPQGSTLANFLSVSWHVNADKKVEVRPEDDFPLRAQLNYEHDATVPGRHIPALVSSLKKTRFPSLYAALTLQEDFAECLALYAHTQLLGQPYAVEVTVDGEVVVSSRDFWSASEGRQKREFMEDFFASLAAPQDQAPFLGLAPFLRMSISGENLRELVQKMLIQANKEPLNAALWMNLATGFFCLELRELGLSIQDQALQQKRLFRRLPSHQPTRFRLLQIMAPGDLSENTPLDCLLEDSQVELIYYYATPAAPLPAELPEHDAIMVAMSDRPVNQPILWNLANVLATWSRPVVNQPGHIPKVDRRRLSQLLDGARGIRIPTTHRLSRSTVEKVAVEVFRLQDVQSDLDYPVIIRPFGSQAGRELAKIEDSKGLQAYLEEVQAQEFFLARFIDYSGADGQFRKCRIALLRGEPFICHMAVSSDWMVHYVNAGMYDAQEKRDEEARFMNDFSSFAACHAAAFSEIYERLQLDYVCIDCAVLPGGELLIFEIDHIMVVHAMDSPRLFPFKQDHIARLRTAFEEFLFSLLPRSQTGSGHSSLSN